MRFTPRLDILPSAQRRLWDELGATPPEFTLYGGTAIALQLGHRQSAVKLVDPRNLPKLSFIRRYDEKDDA